MKKIIFCLLVFAAFACKKDRCNSDCQAIRENNPDFNFDKGWKLIGSHTNASGFANCQDIDFEGANGNLRSYYWQQFSLPTGLIYTNVSVDEYGADIYPSSSSESAFDLAVLNDEHNWYYSLETKFMLRNGKRTVLVQDQSRNPNYWQVYENDMLASESIYQPSDRVTNRDDNAINICNEYQYSNRLAFGYKRFNNSGWDGYSYGYYFNSAASVIGGEKIGNTAYVALSGSVDADSIALALFKIEVNPNWMLVNEVKIPWKQIGYNHFTYLPNANSPIVVLAHTDEIAVYSINLQTGTFTLINKTANPGFQQAVLSNNQVYILHKDANEVYAVSKLEGNSVIPVGSPEFISNANYYKLYSFNDKVYISAMTGYGGQFYIATPE